MSNIALIVGAGAGISASFARLLSERGFTVALAARDTAKLSALCSETGARAYTCDVTDAGQVGELFSTLDADTGCPDVVLFNPSARVRGGIAELDPAAVMQALSVTAYGGFLVGREAARRMQARGSGAIFFTGATASLKGYAQSAAFAMGKFALRGLAQSMARELGPRNIHVAHFIIDGRVRVPGRPIPEQSAEDSWLDPDAIAGSFWNVLSQPRNAWSFEIDLRPWSESF